MENVIPTVRSLIAPVMNTSYQLQDSKVDICLKVVATYADGMWYSAVHVNTQTSLFHIENECTYIVKNVPKQHDMGEKKGG